MTKFVILSTQRSGSNFVRSCLNSHPQIKCLDEVFLHDAGFEDSYVKTMNTDPRFGIHINKYLNGLFDKYKDYKAIGIDVKYNCLTPQVIKAMYDLDMSVIHLVRKDVLKTAISQGIGKRKDAPITFPLEKLRKEYNYLDKMIEIYSDIAGNFRRIDVYYEHLTGGGRNTDVLIGIASRHILDFLMVDNKVSLSARMKKKNPFELAKLLVTHKEVKEFFRVS